MYVHVPQKSKCIKKIMKHIKIRFSSLQKSILIGLVSSREDRPLPSQTQEMAFFRVQKEFQAFIHIASKSCQRDLHIGIQTKGRIAPFSTTRNQPEEVCEYCVVSRISHHVNCLLYLLGPVISYAPAGCFVAFFNMFSPGTQAMEGRRQAAAPQGLLL